MSNSYRYTQRYWPCQESRFAEMVSFLKNTLPVLGSPALFDSRDVEVPCEEKAVAALFADRLKSAQFPECGVDLDLFAGIGDPETVSRYDFHVGTAPGEVFIDFFSLQYSRDVTPFTETNLLKRLLSIGEPFEAFLAENINEIRLNAKQRQNQTPNFSRPAMIRGIHYLGPTQVAKLGGVGICQKAPAYSVEPLGDGVLIRLVPGVFNPQNPADIREQSSVMNYFGI